MVAAVPAPAFDQVLNEGDNALTAGRLSLSSLGHTASASASWVAPAFTAVSPDGSALALLRQEYGQSRLYLVKVDSEAGPKAIFSSNDRLYNLQWSPLGNALLFAREPAAVVTTLLHAADPRPADLLMLDLETLAVTVLIDSTPDSREPSASV